MAVDDIIQPRVQWRDRKYTDVHCGLLFMLGLTLFIGLGFGMVGSANVSYLTEDGVLTLHGDVLTDAESCCAGLEEGASDGSYNFDSYSGVCSFVVDEDGRRSLTTSTNFPSNGGMLDAFAVAPVIPATLIAMAIFVAVLWVSLLRNFATPIVFATEACKVAGIIYIACKVDDDSRSFFIIVALLYCGLVYWKRDKLIFAGKIISHSALALQKNPTMFVGLLGVKMFYVLQAFLFVLFMAKSVEVKEIKEISNTYNEYDEDTGELTSSTTTKWCDMVEPAWIGSGRTIICFVWLWSVMFYSQVRLNIVASQVGSWHFHPQDPPTVTQSVISAVTTSFGTLSLSALILAILTRIKKTLQFRWYHHCLTAGTTIPLHFIGCILLWCLDTCIKMLTKFTTIIHTFTGLAFMDSAKKCYALMNRHFENGFITDAASTSVLSLGAFVFSLAITFSAWAWIDEYYGWATLPQPGQTENIVIFYLWFFFIMFNLWYPILGVALILLISFLLEYAEVGGQEHWVSPLSAAFVGVISMLFMQYVAGIILDTIDVCFVCYAVDKDNNVGLEEGQEDEFAVLIMELPGVKTGTAPQEVAQVNAGQLVFDPATGKMVVAGQPAGPAAVYATGVPVKNSL